MKLPAKTSRLDWTLSHLILAGLMLGLTPVANAATAEQPEPITQPQLEVEIESPFDQVSSGSLHGLQLAGNDDREVHIVVNADPDVDLQALKEELDQEMHEMGKELKGVVKVLKSLSDEKMQDRVFLGVLLDYEQGVDEGLKLVGVTPEGPAQKAGLQSDDIILEINGQSLQAQDGKRPEKRLQSVMKQFKPGDELDLLVRRDGSDRHVKLTTGRRGDHLQQGVRFLIKDIEKRVSDQLDAAFSKPDSAIAEMKLFPINKGLGRHFKTSQGLLVLAIPDSVQGGLQEGDVILKVGGREPDSVSRMWRILDTYDSGETVPLDIVRDGEQQRIDLVMP